MRVYETPKQGGETPPLHGIRDVMIFTPVKRLEPETVLALMKLEWDGALSLVMQRDNPSGDPKKDHLHQYQRGREMFLRGPYEAMLIIESDMIPPKDVLVRLASLNVDCAYGVYLFRESEQLNITELYPMEPNPKMVGESLTFKPYLLERAVKEGRFPCSGSGFGVILIRRRAIEQIPFRLDDLPWTFCDASFTDDAVAAGFTMAAEMRTICGHKDVDGTVLWPEYAEELAR